ncbi:MAG: pyridoxamine 5'-phosphate oxidase family protein [Rhodothermales bacterium]|nr:pyridoxamine 5'-phosphate oxidase family protein [Rhodothermales bacterium]
MATFYDALTDELQVFIEQQPIFFTGSAPADGRVNVSPKGMDSFRCFDARTVGYLDVTGSGNEAAAHIGENGRLTIMFCSFTRQTLILRLYGRGEVARRGTARWAELIDRFTLLRGARQIVVLHIDSVQTSCGYAVPIMEYVRDRDTLVKWAGGQTDEELVAYRERKNTRSIDGLPTGSWLLEGH